MNYPLKIGDKNPDVGKVQELLNSAGANLKVDNDFGGKTQTALIKFQVGAGLAGVFDKNTHFALKKSFVDTSEKFPPMSATRRESVFGKFDWVPGDGDEIDILGDWESKNIKEFFIPQLKGLPYYEPGNTLLCNGKIRLHRLAGSAFCKFFNLVEDEGLKHLIRTFDGAHVARRIRNRSGLSNHAWGTAIDINQYANGLGRVPAKVGEDGCVRQLVALAHSCGIYWGGNFDGSRIDGMHFEIAVV